MTDNIRTLGCDTSHWAGSINFETMYNAGARFWVTKATDAYKTSPIQYEDSKFMEFSTAAFEHGKMLNGCYHWLQMSIDPIVAADFYLERYNRFNFHLPPIMDFEERYVIDTGKFSDYAWRAQMWLEHVEKQTGRRPIVYTAKWFTELFKDEYISWMNKYPLWVADYTWYANNILNKPYRMPTQWDTHLIWQFSADGNKRGAEFGVGAVDIDLNWFEGSYEDLLKFCNITTTPQPPIEPDPVDPEIPPSQDIVLPKLTVIKNVNIRPVPSTTIKETRTRQAGETVKIEEIKVHAIDNIWVRDQEGWSALIYYKTVFMK